MSNPLPSPVPLPTGDALLSVCATLGLQCDTYQSQVDEHRVDLSVQAPNGWELLVSDVDVEHTSCAGFLDRLARMLDQWHAGDHCHEDDGKEWELAIEDERYFHRMAEHVRTMTPTVTALACLYQPTVIGPMDSRELVERVWHATMSAPTMSMVGALLYSAVIKARDEKETGNERE